MRKNPYPQSTMALFMSSVVLFSPACGNNQDGSSIAPTLTAFTPTPTACCLQESQTPTPTASVTVSPTATVDPADLPPPQIVINELMAQNGDCLLDGDGDSPDWIELYNPGERAVDLEGVGLSDDPEEDPWLLPAMELPAKGHLLVFASGKDRVDGELHTSFKLSASGETLTLTWADGTLADELSYEDLEGDISLGRAPDGSDEWRLFDCGSPGGENGDDGLLMPALRPEISQTGGVFGGALEITLTGPEGAEIHYTMDGSEPNSSSPLYSHGLSITSRIGEENEHSQIPTNHIVSDGSAYVWKPPKGEIPKVSLLRARVYQDGKAPSPVISHTYLLDAPIDGALNLPFLSLQTNDRNLFDYDEGLYIPGLAWDDAEAAGYSGSDSSHPANYHWKGIDYERPAHLALYRPDGTLEFSEELGFRIHGNTSRAYPFKSFRFYLRDDYGRNHVDYDLFAEGEERRVELILLRSSGGDFGGTLFKDALNHSLALEATTLELSTYRPTVLYLNGEYWGIHNLRERLDDEYLTEKYDIDGDDIVILEDEGVLDHGTQEDVTAYQSFISFVDGADVSDPAVFTQVEAQVDIDNFIEYYIFQTFVQNQDWPQSNVKYWRHRTTPENPGVYDPEDGRWRFGVFDTDHSLWDPTVDNIARLLDPEHRFAWATILFRGLNENDEFRERFVSRYVDALNSWLAPTQTTPPVDAYRAQIAPYMPLQIYRWQYPAGINGWESKVDSVRSFLEERPTYMLTHLGTHFGYGAATPLAISVAGNGGDVSVGSVSIDEGDGATQLMELVGLTVTLEANAEDGQSFLGWSGDVSGTSPTVSVEMPEGGLSVEALFSDN